MSPLEDELDGFHRQRAGRFRIILKLAESGAIDAFSIKSLSIVYEFFATTYAHRLVAPNA